MHDVEHIDLQVRHDANLWLQDITAAGNKAAWSETANTWVAVRLTTQPAVGDVLVLPVNDGIYAYTSSGHVAYVEQVLTGGRFQVSQQSYGDPAQPYTRFYTWSLDSIQAPQHQNGQARFIHVTGGTPSPQPFDDASFLTQSPPPVVGPGQQVHFYFLLENSGTTTWSDASGYALTCVANCLGAGPAGFGGQSVPPGQQFSFSEQLTAPKQPGTYPSAWVMEHEGTQFGEATLCETIMVSAATPAPAPTVVPGGLWISPQDGQTISDPVHFAAHAYPTNPGDPAIQFVNFTVESGGVWKVACVAPSSQASGDVLACDAQLGSLGTAIGSVQVSFDVYDVEGNVNLAPNGEHSLNYVLTQETSTCTLSAPPPAFTHYPTLVPAYQGMAHNVTGGDDSAFTLSAVTQQQANISGTAAFYSPLVGTGPFTGHVTTSGAISFVEVPTDWPNDIYYTGWVLSSGSMLGTYNDPISGQCGIWQVSPKA